jgi:hypothetical protein
MEAAADPGWATKLKPIEVSRAVRYALWELNDLPPWLTSLTSARPEAVIPVLLGEIFWELRRQPEDSSSYVLARLRWSDKTLGQMLCPQIIGLLSRHRVTNVKALEEALTLVFAHPAPLPQDFIAVAAKRADEPANEELKALWLAALLCVDAPFAVPLMENSVADTPEKKLAEHRISLVLNHVWGERLRGLNRHQSFRKAGLLVRLIKLSHTCPAGGRFSASRGVFARRARLRARSPQSPSQHPVRASRTPNV